MKKYWIIFILAFHLLHSESISYIQVADRSNLNVLTPSLKDRRIEKIRLSNGLSVYLVHDPKIDQAAAALSVNIGSWHDPAEYPGMAHFLEHMLFKGTKSYPEENGFFQFIYNHAGSFNAYTAPDRTVYMFSVNNDGLTEGLDRFSHFFIDPLFSKNGVQRELFVVDQEHKKNIENDLWRLYMVSKHIGNPNHPNAKFSTGNSETLSKIPHHSLKKWFSNHYSANLMYLTVISSMPMDQLKQQVIEKFSSIPNRGYDPLYINQPLSSNESKGTITYVKPVRKIDKMYIEIELPKSYASDDSKSAQIIAYALRRGQKYNLEQTLIQKDLIERLSIDTERIGPHHITFQVELELTKKGLSNPFEVLSICFDAINGLKKGGIPSYLYDEMQRINKLEYLYQQREEPFEFVQTYAHHLIDESLSTFPKNTIVGSSYNEKKVKHLLKFLTVENAQIYLLCDPKNADVFLDQQEKWMKVKYTTQKIKPEQLEKINSFNKKNNIRIASPNPFLPNNLKLVNIEKAQPFKLIDDPAGQVYLAQEEEFTSPEVSLHLHILSPNIKDEKKSLTLCDLFLEHLHQTLNPIISCAKDANLTAKFSIDQCKFNITIEGFSEKAPLFVEEIFKGMIYNYPSKKRFDQLKSRLKKQYSNTSKELPIHQAMEVLSSILSSDRITSKEHLETLNEISYQDYLDFHKTLFKKTYLQGFFAGNLSIKQSESIIADIKHLISHQAYPENQWNHRKIFPFSSQLGPYKMNYSTGASGNSCLLTLDLGSFSFEKRAAQEILAQVLKETFFDELRSKQKTGYIVQAPCLEKEKRLFQMFVVQSSTHQPEDLLYRYELFLENFLQNFSDQISEDRFNSIKQNQIIKLQHAMRNLSIKASILDKFAFEYNDLQWMKKRIQGLQSLTYESFKESSYSFLSKENRKRLAILMKGKAQANAFFYQEINKTKLAEMEF